MPDYNPAVAAGIKPPENDFASTLGMIANLQEKQALTGYYTLQGLQQQRKYNALMSGAQDFQQNHDIAHAANVMAVNGADPADINNFIKIPGTLASTDAEIRSGAGSVAQAYVNNPSAATRQAMIDYTAKYQGPDKARELSGLSNADLMSRARGHIGAGLTVEQGSKPVETQTAQGAPQYQTTGQFVAGGPQTGQTQEAKEEAQKRGAAQGEYLSKVQDEAAAAKTMNFTLGQMEDESKGFTMGAYAPHLTTFAKYMKPLANAVGNTSFDNWVGTNEDFAKNAGVLARQGVREISNRPSQFEFQIVSSQMPHDAMSQQGFQGIVDQFRAVNDFKQAKAFAAQKWQDTKGTSKGFEADWNSHIGPAAFLIANMSPEQRQKLSIPQAQRDSISRQLKWAADNGLESGIQ